MILHKACEDGERPPIDVYGMFFRQREQQVQRRWGWKVHIRDSKEAQQLKLMVKEDLV